MIFCYSNINVEGQYKIFVLNDGSVREDALTQNLKTRLIKDNYSITTDYKNADMLVYTTCAETGYSIVECLKTSYCC